MRFSLPLLSALALAASPLIASPSFAQDSSRVTPAASPPRVVDPRVAKLKEEARTMVEARAKQVQEIVDMLFSFQELGFQEFESQKYLTGILEKEGFKVERGVAGIPSSWIARWGS